MAPKKMSTQDSDDKKKRMLGMDIKQEIIKKHERGIRVSNLCKEYGRSSSTICTILKNKASIMAAATTKGKTTLASKRSDIHEEMESLLLTWVQTKQVAGDTISQAIISEKARAIFNDLLLTREEEGEPSTSKETETFKASHGWFERFKKRTGIHSVVRHGEAASADKRAAEDFIEKFSGMIKTESYVSNQVFNCDETGLFWKKMPRRTYITEEESRMPGHKPMKDRLTLAFCANASGDFKVKPLLVYHAENPRAFKAHKVLKDKLPVMWRANPKAWVTRQYFVEWVNVCFGPQVKQYLLDKNLPLKCLLVLDNAPAHPPGLEDEILEEFDFIRVLYLPPNTTSILQPMDQQCIANFKKLYTKFLFERCFEIVDNTDLTLRLFWKDHFNIAIALKLIDRAWQGVTRRTLNSSWRKLWPACIQDRDFEGFVEDEEPQVIDDIVSIGKTMGLEIDEGDVNELVAEHSEELTTGELKELHTMQHSELLEQLSSEEDEDSKPEQPLTTKEIKDMFVHWEAVKTFVDAKHPEKMHTGRAIGLFSDTCLAYFRKILKGRQKQTSLDRYFKRSKEFEVESSEAKRAKGEESGSEST